MIQLNELPQVIKFDDLVEWTSHREGSLYLACNGRNAFFHFRKA